MYIYTYINTYTLTYTPLTCLWTFIKNIWIQINPCAFVFVITCTKHVTVAHREQRRRWSLVLHRSLRISRIVISFHHNTLTWFRKCRIGPHPPRGPPLPSIASRALVNPRRIAGFPVICDLDFSTSGLFAQYPHGSQWKAWPRKHRYSSWNVVDILSGSVETYISSSEAAILVFSTSGLVAYYSRGSRWEANPRKHRCSRWNFVHILSGSEKTCILSFEATAILILSNSGLVA